MSAARRATDSNTRIDQLTDALADQAEKTVNDYVHLEIQLPMLMIVVSQIQLALTHPLNSERPAEFATHFVRTVQEMFRTRGLTAYVDAIEEGWRKESERANSGEETPG